LECSYWTSSITDINQRTCSAANLLSLGTPNWSPIINREFHIPKCSVESLDYEIEFHFPRKCWRTKKFKMASKMAAKNMKIIIYFILLEFWQFKLSNMLFLFILVLIVFLKCSYNMFFKVIIFFDEKKNNNYEKYTEKMWF
jgi:hypothetical protein